MGSEEADAHKGEAAKEYDVGEAPAVCKRLVINAQTGEIEPYLIEKQEPAYCPRVITWEEVH